MTKSTDTVFLERLGADGGLRLVLSQQVVDAIVRQRDALGGKVRRAAAKRTADARKARGEKPAFLKRKKGSHG